MDLPSNEIPGLRPMRIGIVALLLTLKQHLDALLKQTEMTLVPQ